MSDMLENPGTNISPEEIEKLLADAGMTEEEFNSQISEQQPKPKTNTLRNALEGLESKTDEKEKKPLLDQSDIDKLFSGNE